MNWVGSHAPQPIAAFGIDNEHLGIAGFQVRSHHLYGADRAVAGTQLPPPPYC